MRDAAALQRESVRGERFLWLLLAVAFLLALLIARPFAQAFLLAAVLATVLHPLFRRLERRFPKRRVLIAGSMTVATLLIILLPLAGLVAFLADDVVNAIRSLAQFLRTEGVSGLWNHVPEPIRHLAAVAPVSRERVQNWLTSLSGQAAALVGGAVQATGIVLVKTILMLIALYFFLVDGVALVRWLERVSPLGIPRTRELFVEFRRVSVSVLVSDVATAGVQALVALVGYLVTGVPFAFALTLCTFFFGLVPMIGAGTVTFMTGVIMFLLGHPVKAVVLIAWALFFVGLIDNVVRPLFIRGGVEIHGGVIFFAVLGGLATFGPIGLLVGPLTVAFLLALIRFYQRDREAQAGVPLPTPRPPAPPSSEAVQPGQDVH